MKYLLETNPAFLILELEGGDYVFYNSLQYVGARLTQLELLILELVYKFQDKDYIISKFPQRQHEKIAKAIDAIIKLNLLKCEDIKYEKDLDVAIPSEFYIHLTYRCNLKCEYCYNKSIRKNVKPDMSVEEWKGILDKIIPYANRLIFTGGECLLYHEIADLMKYIKEKKPSVVLSVISNGMHDFQIISEKGVFDYISELSLSCDSLYKEGMRIGFNPDRFRRNISWLQNNYPKIRLTIASVYTRGNESDIIQTQEFCESHRISFDKTVLLPESPSEIELMPSFAECHKNQMRFIKNNTVKKLNKARFSCGAGKSTCSIDPYGNVFPCQSLHYPEFNMGNLKTSDLISLKHIGAPGTCLKDVNELSVCSKCKVKYICGGGCLATGYSLYGHKLDRNHLSCHLNYYNAIEKLKSLDNRLL